MKLDSTQGVNRNTCNGIKLLEILEISNLNRSNFHTCTTLYGPLISYSSGCHAVYRMDEFTPTCSLIQTDCCWEFSSQIG